MQLVRAELTSVIAGHPRATTTYRFYEELNAWLGPWGRRGYPIGYGKAYNVAFNSNPLLKTRSVTQTGGRRRVLGRWRLPPQREPRLDDLR